MSWLQIKQPPKLEYFAVKNLATWITSQAETLIDLHARNPTQAEEMLSKQIEITQNYIQDNLPRAFHDKLVEEVVDSLLILFNKVKWSLESRQKENVQIYPWKAFGRMIETVLSKYVTVLLLPDSSWEIFETSIESKCEALTGLEDVGLPCGINEYLCMKLFKKWNSLKRLRSCPANMLKCMVQNCKLVEEITLYDFDLTDIDINTLIELRNLRSVELYGTYRVTEIGIENLLMSCENLERIYHVDIPKTLERINKLKENSEKQFKLNSYDNFHETSMEQLQIFTRHCPFTQEVYLEKKREYVGDQNYLEPLKELLHLRELKLTSFNFYTDGVNEVLEARGCNLSYLELWHTSEMDLNSLKCIIEMCPRLQSLLLCCSGFVKRSFTVQKLTNELEMAPLKYLELFKLSITHRSQPTPEQLQFLLTNCQNVGFIEIMNDKKSLVFQDSMMSVLDKNPKNFMNLKKLVTNECLSVLVIDRIVQNCIYPPEITAVIT